MIDKKQLCEFLVKAKSSTYATGNLAKKIIENNKSTTLIFEEGDWRYNDNYFGGEPFGGREVVFLKNDPVYIMVYYGRVNEVVKNFEPVYTFLQKALSQIPVEYPFRGPKNLQENNLEYINEYTGVIDDFSGEEKILKDKKEIYRAKYIGGLINQKN